MNLLAEQRGEDQDQMGRPAVVSNDMQLCPGFSLSSLIASDIMPSAIRLLCSCFIACRGKARLGHHIGPDG